MSALVALLAVLALAAPIGCGGDEGDYADELPPIDRQTVVLGDRVEAALQAAGRTGDAALAERFSGFGRTLGRLRERLDDLEPPERLAPAQDALSTAMGSVRGALEQTASAARRGDAPAARAASNRLVRAGERLADARRELAEKVARL